MEICAYSTADIPAMLRIWNEVVTEGQAFPQESPEDEDSAREFFASQSFCGVARDDTGAITGLYILHPNNVGRCGHICNASYAVQAEQRGRGIGRALVRHSLLKAKELGFRIMQFNAVTADNAAANALYPQLGFISIGTIPEGFRRPDGSWQAINLYYRNLEAFTG